MRFVKQFFTIVGGVVTLGVAALGGLYLYDQLEPTIRQRLKRRKALSSGADLEDFYDDIPEDIDDYDEDLDAELETPLRQYFTNTLREYTDIVRRHVKGDVVSQDDTDASTDANTAPDAD